MLLNTICNSVFFFFFPRDFRMFTVACRNVLLPNLLQLSKTASYSYYERAISIDAVQCVIRDDVTAQLAVNKPRSLGFRQL